MAGKTLSATGLVTVLMLGTPLGWCETATSGGQPQHEAASVVEQYRELRRTCAGLTDEEKKSCFHELSAYNGKYRLAKQELDLYENEDKDNIHLVTF